MLLCVMLLCLGVLCLIFACVFWYSFLQVLCVFLYFFVCIFKEKERDGVELAGGDMGGVRGGEKYDQNILYNFFQLKIN